MMPASILIPCKSLRGGKSRLSACLNGAARYALCSRLLENTLRCAAAVAAPTTIRIVTDDPEAGAIACRHAIDCIADPGFGLNAALEHARANLPTALSRDTDLVVLPIDLPLIEPQCIADALMQAADIVIAPDESGTGTNLLVLKSSAVRRLSFAFGSGSYAAHVALARDIGLRIATVHDRRLAFDLDGPAHYVRWLAEQDEERPCAIDR